MYLPKHFRPKDPEIAHEIIRDYPLALVLTEGGREVNPLPLLVRHESNTLILEGHIARANPLRAAIEAGAEVSAIFQGPQGYISPTWYANADNVPTWNYAVVVARGNFRPTDGAGETLAVMERLVTRLEGERGWSLATLPVDARDGLFRAIVGFRITVHSLETKIKMSQNRDQVDRESVSARLEKSGETRHSDMAALIRRANPHS